jgi:lipopolysaccharide transport system permease protein
MSGFGYHLRSIWKHREIVYFLALKDIKIRYKFSSLGFLWAIIQPLGQMIILSVVFSLVVRFKIPAYPAFLLVGLLPWSFFSISVNFTTPAMMDNSNLIKKVYFPRDIIPIAQILSNLFDYCIALVILVPFLLFFGIGFSRQLILLPFVIVVQLILTTGVCLLLSSLTVIYRDIKYMKELLLMFGFYASPVFYPASFVQDNMGSFAHTLYFLNPMAGLLQFYRCIFYYQQWPGAGLIVYTSAVSFLILIIGFKVFQKYERLFADLV